MQATFYWLFLLRATGWLLNAESTRLSEPKNIRNPFLHFYCGVFFFFVPRVTLFFTPCGTRNDFIPVSKIIAAISLLVPHTLRAFPRKRDPSLVKSVRGLRCVHTNILLLLAPIEYIKEFCWTVFSKHKKILLLNV